MALEELSLALGEVQVPSRVPGVGSCIAVQERNRNSNLFLASIERSLTCFLFLFSFLFLIFWMIEAVLLLVLDFF